MDKATVAALRMGEVVHCGECKKTIGPRGGEAISVQRWRVIGACKTWKLDPSRFERPVAHGLFRKYAHGHLDQYTAPSFHREKDCPLR